MLAPGHCGAARYKLARDENWKERERDRVEVECDRVAHGLLRCEHTRKIEREQV